MSDSGVNRNYHSVHVVMGVRRKAETPMIFAYSKWCIRLEIATGLVLHECKTVGTANCYQKAPDRLWWFRNVDAYSLQREENAG